MGTRKAGLTRGAIELQPRDWEFLLGLFDSRVMTVAQAGDIYFAGRLAMARKRVGRLKRAGLLLARPAPVGTPSVIHLSRAGLRVLADHGLVAAGDAASLSRLVRRAYVSERTLAHEVAVMGAVAALHRGARQGCGLAVSWFSTRPRPPAPGGAAALRPDCEMRLSASAPDRSERVFIEADNSTESLRVIRAKLARYVDSAPGGSVVLFVVESAARRRNIERASRDIAALAEFRIRVALGSDLRAAPAEALARILS